MKLDEGHTEPRPQHQITVWHGTAQQEQSRQIQNKSEKSMMKGKTGLRMQHDRAYFVTLATYVLWSEILNYPIIIKNIKF